jgi:AraC family transcriptional regulator of adaptative response/methylated-DNA-[protein]-cysteine methyltransferase
MMRAFSERDASYDGIFFAAVTTTGIFCRPSCSARKPLAEHVVFYGGASEALFGGYRPCKRCRPLQSTSDPAWVESLIEKIEDEPETRIRDGDLRARGLDPATVRRRFLSRFGLTFHAYQRARRLSAAFEDIKSGGSIDDAVFDHGYESHAGFRDAFARLFGGPPGRATKGGGDFIRISWIDSALGPLVAGATNRGVAFLEFSDRRMMEAQALTLRKRHGLPVAPGRNEIIDRLESELSDYFAGKLRSFSLPIDEPGTDFQERVWNTLRTIPYGATWSYGELAVAVGDPNATRAVARANGMNRVAILVPCHRVIGYDGGLGGYGGGIWRKQRLLEIEGALQGR